MRLPIPIRKVLCIRPDNMGDVLMSTPAMRALKETFNASITLLTSEQGGAIAPLIPFVDEVLLFNAPWVQHNGAEAEVLQLVACLRDGAFDLAVIFTVSSQNPLPSAMLAYMAGIPLRLAYCRENPYRLLTHWVPDPEPLRCMDKHQVQRDLDLVGFIGAHTTNRELQLKPAAAPEKDLTEQLTALGVDPAGGWCVLHPGTRDLRRKLPADAWVDIGVTLLRNLDMPLLLTGSVDDVEEVKELRQRIGAGSYALAGKLELGAFVHLISKSALLISINSLPMHVAAAVQTPVVALYAKTNPQHLPWQVPAETLFFDVPENQRSRNEILQFMHRHYSWKGSPVSPQNVLAAAQALLRKSRPATATTAS
ncbi:glycosyltransferase family 9 protein [Niabella sp. CC-SYL272]|uniref:glycosyltransferase family 9 protein n=1 Tax=Niabella agricola TaxID=2891571 RepID=UPI001F2CCD63|nr:glycosyltransferase family 9 protein [Niabella agricola]MCF3108330.1 glycosyltransferase family 9 protein [Niabella agricola]